MTRRLAVLESENKVYAERERPRQVEEMAVATRGAILAQDTVGQEQTRATPQVGSSYQTPMSVGSTMAGWDRSIQRIGDGPAAQHTHHNLST
jgi:hypothetical protein